MSSRIQLASGAMFDLLNPDPSVITIDVIAHALSRLCRFTGHVSTAHYSVAEHSVRVSWLVPDHDAREGLLHDAAEAFVGDVAAPLKRLLPDYQAIEKRVELAVAERFGLLYPWPLSVKEADIDMLRLEAVTFMRPEGIPDWAPVLARKPVRFEQDWQGQLGWGYVRAFESFIDRAKELGIR